MRIRTIIAISVLLTASVAYASGGSCPSGSGYLTGTGSETTLASLGVTSCFYISASGSDSNSGTSEGSPWLHAPGMSTATGNAASTTPAGGEGFIFHGGDTWHMGNSGASPYTGGTWNRSWSGSSGSPIYWGVDLGWGSGRPILTGDNALTPHPGTYADSVSSCSYQVGGANQFVNDAGNNYIIFDDFEMTGMCENDIGAPFQHDVYLMRGSTGYFYERLYVHGWTHTGFSFSGVNWNIEAFSGATGETGVQDVVDGADSDPGGGGVNFLGGSVMLQSVFRYTSQIVTTTFHDWHDNLFEHWYEPSDGLSHGNVFESSGEPASNNVFYGNVLRNIGTDQSGMSFVNIWPEPSVGFTDYLFGNVEYDTDYAINGNWINIGQNSNSGDQGTVDSFGNTWENTTNATMMTCAQGGFSEVLNLVNNHYVTDASGPYAGCPSSTTYTSELVQSHATASGQGYTAGETFGFSPASGCTSGGCSTVGSGSSVSTFVSALTGSSDPLLQAAGAAAQSATGFACAYNTSSHTVSCPAAGVIARTSPPDRGAYQNGINSGGGTTYTLNLVISPPGAATVNTTNNCGPGTYAASASIGPCTATPASGYAFTPGWSGPCTGTSTCSFSLSGNTTMTASLTSTSSLAITTTSPLPGGIVGSPYNLTMAATGGTPPYSWSDPSCSGACDTGLYFPASGVWSGTPVNAGTSLFTIQVADSAGASVSSTFSLTIGTTTLSTPVLLLSIP